MKIPNFSGLRPSPPFKDSTYTGICYLQRLWVLVRERALRKKISGGSRKYRKGVYQRKVGCARKGGCKVVPSYGLCGMHSFAQIGIIRQIIDAFHIFFNLFQTGLYVKEGKNIRISRIGRHNFCIF